MPLPTTATADETTVPETKATTTAVTEPTEATTASEVTESATTEPTESTVVTTTTEAVTTEAPETPPSEPVTEVITTEPITDVPTEVPTDPPVKPEVRTVTFTNSFNWSGEIRCYYWSDSDTNMTPWPGVAMNSMGNNDFGEALYTFDVPEGVSWIIFTNGSSQTVDIPFGGEARYYPVNVTNDKGHFNVETW